MQSVPLNKTLPDTKIDNGIWNPCSSLWDQGIDWQDISNWRGHEVGVPRPERPGSSDWTNKSGEVIVDAQDKETWPTIGDKTEATLDGGDSDSASVKSVISSSSAPSQGHGDTSGQGSAMQGQNQSSSSLWGMTSMNTNTDAKLDSENSWGIAPQTSVSSSMWDSSSSSKTAAQSTSMQGIPNGISTSGSISNVMPTSTNSTGGWGDSLPGDGTYPGNNSGAQNEAGSGQSSSFGSAMWQGIRNMSGGSLSNIDNKEAASQGSGWGSQSSSSSVIGSGLSISASSSGGVFNTKGVSAMNQESANVGQWGQPSTTSAGGDMWGGTGGGAGSTASTGSFENRNTSSKPEATGWGSPSPSPIPNAGTEGWGQPDQKKEPPQAWGQVPTSTTGWDQRRRASSSAWEETSSADRRQMAGWGGEAKADGSGNWSQNRQAPSAWGSPAETKASQCQWGSSGASGPQSQWPDSNASQATSATTNASQIGAWGSGNPMTAARPQQPPRPIGTQVPPTQGPHPSLPSQQPQPQALPHPGSWAEAAGRGLTSAKPSPVGSTTRKLTKEDIIAEAINTPENWGKVPVRQDSSWDRIEDSPKLPRKPLGSSSSTGSQEDLHWNQPNNGTAIWESAKEPTSSPSVWDRASGGASGSSSEWGVSSDNDGGTWNGDNSQQQAAAPQSQDSNMWQGPPPNTSTTWNQPPNRSNSNTWGGNDERPGSNSWSSGSSGSNDSKKNWQSSAPPASGQPGPVAKSDNVWDRNGTSLWGDPDKTETGTWGADGMRRNSSGSWDREPETGQWGQPDNSSRGVEAGASYWGNPDRIPGHWNNPNNPPAPVTHAPQPITGRPPSDKLIWGQTVPPSKPGWGETSPPGAREDTAMWNQTARPAGWGDNQWQKRNPSTSSWGETNEWNAMNATRKPPQRSRMLQQLMDMGFKKEDAQNALIRNDMDLDRAINDLVTSAKRPEYDTDAFRGRQLKGMGSCEDLADAQVEFLPPQNTLTNAQGLHNTQVIASPYAKQGPSLPHMSSLTAAPSINPLHQKLLPQQLSKPPVPGQPAQPIRGQLPNQTQQMIQAQIVQQLQMAVQAGLISPQLLNQHLTPAMLVMLQQLLQLQQLYQQLVAQQQVLQQNKALAPLHQRSQLEQVSLTITKIKQKIAQVQQALAKQAGCQQPTPAGIDPNKELLKDLQADISNLHLKDNPIIPPQQQPQHSNQPGQQSRLTQWKLPSPDKDIAGHLTIDLNRAPGSRPVGPHSTPPNLQNKLEPGVSFADPWSSSLATASTVWPSTSTTVTTTAALPHTDTKTNAAPADDKESSGNQSKQCSEDQSAASANSTNPATPTSSAALDIEEFVPGKPWQGIITKSVDDDPNLTPGQVAMRRPLSINTIKDEYVMSTLGKSSSSNSLNTSPTVSDGTTTSSSWSSAGGPASLASSASSPNLLEKSTWSTTPSESAPGVLASSDIWGMSGVGAASKNRRPPPGLINRSVSCPGGPGSWGSTWIILKNLPSQIDGGTVKNLCIQQGSLQTFLHSAQYGQAYVCYKSREDAIKAQKSLNALVFGNTAIIAEFVNDAEVARLQELSGTSPVAPHSSAGSPHWSQQPLHSGLRPAFGGPKFEQAAHLNGAANFSVGASSSGSMWGSGGSGGLWGPIEEHADNHMLPGGLLGGH